MATIQDIFLAATRDKYRFDSAKGKLTVEQLWDVPLESRDNFNLDRIAIDLNTDLNMTQGTQSFVRSKGSATTDKIRTLNNKLEIVKFIIEWKLDLLDKRTKQVEDKQKKARLLEALASKQEESLRQMSEEELRKELEKLGA